MPDPPSTIDLNGRWKFRAENKYRTLPGRMRRVLRWMNATVPGTVHTDLLAAGKIPDPFYRLNENDVQWIDTQQWRYRREFRVPRRFLSHRRHVLVAEGLDTYASVLVNGKRVSERSNMFIAQRIDISGLLRPGINRIEILFDSPTLRAGRLEKKHGRLLVSHGHERVYVRKAQYSFGWDWGPKLTTSGIWRNISIEGASGAQLAHPFVRVRSASRKSAELHVSIEVRHRTNDPLILRTTVRGGDKPIGHTFPVTGDRVSFRIRIPDPALWWPNGLGSQPMYAARFSLLSGGREIHSLEAPFAIRTVRLLQRRDREGKTFVLEVNRVKVFCKGADWIPSDTFLPRIPDSTYKKLLTMARDAHMNMIRVWGGGVYEREVFYEQCDRLGLMVWQDFMYACGEYPEQAWFLDEARNEAEHVVKRLRNHPSIVLWCGNNECEWLYCMRNPEGKPDDMTGARIFRDILRKVCAERDGTRPYWRSSPFGSGFPNAESNGNHHQWAVWSAWRDFKEYEMDHARFVTEFGFQSTATFQTMKPAMRREDREIQSAVMEHHNKQTEGTERLIRFQAAHYRLAGNLGSFIYKSQLVQAEALKRGVEHWRRRKFLTAGSIFWQLNDCWPVSSWAVIDGGLRPKAAYYYASRFFAPILLSFKKVPEGVQVWLTNDRLTPVAGHCHLALRSFGGKNRWRKRVRVHAPPNSSRVVYRIPGTLIDGHDPFAHYLHASLHPAPSRDNQVAPENRLYLAEPKHMQLPRPNVSAKVLRIKNGDLVLRLHSDVLAMNVRVDLPGATLTDNFVDLDPGRTRIIRIISSRSPKELNGKISLRWL